MYAQHETSSQVIFILKRLSNELVLKTKDSPSVTIRTSAEETTPANWVVQIKLEFLTTKKVFSVKDVVVGPDL